MIHVAAFTGGEDVPSARCRVRQLIPKLIRHDIAMKEWKAALSCYPPQRKALRPFWAIATLGQRIPGIIASYSADVIFLQREMLSTFMTLEKFTKQPRVFDVDDAIWLNRTSQYAGKLAESCDLVICGNEYLAEYFSDWNKNISIIPTPIDTNKFKPTIVDNEILAKVEPIFERRGGGRNFHCGTNFRFLSESGGILVDSTTDEDDLIIGWMGTSSNIQYINKIENALCKVMDNFPRARLRIVSDQRPQLRKIPSTKLEFIQWSPENEVSCIQGLSVGIMPLEDSLWARGKCSYKMLQYLACGVPVVVSPVGMNNEVLGQGQCGFGACDEREWVEGLTTLLEDAKLRRQMGKIGRQVVLDHYSLEALALVLSDCLKRTAKVG